MVKSLHLILLFLSSLIWLSALAALGVLCPRYLPDGEVLLFSNFDELKKDADKSLALPKTWHCSKEGVVWELDAGFAGSAGFRLTALGKGYSYMQWDLNEPRRFSFLKFRGKMRTENIIEGKESWHTASFIVFFRDGEGRSLWECPHLAGSLSGSSAWREFSQVFPVPNSAVSAHVMIQNNAISGTMWCDDFFLGPVCLNPQYGHYRNLLLVLGGVLALVYAIALKIWRGSGWLALVIVVLIVLGVLCPKNYVEVVGNYLQVNVTTIQKIGHLLIFVMLGIISSIFLNRRVNILSNGRISIKHALLFFVVLSWFAAMTEFIQLLTIDRRPAVSDWLIDSVGILLGISIAWVSLNKEK